MKQIQINDKLEYDMDVSPKDVIVKFTKFSDDWSEPGALVVSVSDTSEHVIISFPDQRYIKVEYYEVYAMLSALLTMKEDKLTITEQIKILEI